MSAARRMGLSVNGVPVEVSAAPGTPLIYVLRNDLGLKATRFGCGEGACGACTVLVDGRAVTSCDLPVDAVAGKHVTTVEGLGDGGALHPVQQAFLDLQAAQCAYCIDGIVMATVALLRATPHPSDDDIRRALARHLCRCGAHVRILRAIRAASEAMAR